MSEKHDSHAADARALILGWREIDWPEGFDRRTAEIMAAEMASRLLSSATPHPALDLLRRMHRVAAANGRELPFQDEVEKLIANGSRNGEPA